MIAEGRRGHVPRRGGGLLRIGRLGRCFKINGTSVIGTISSIAFSVCRNRAFKLINRSNSNGAAANQDVVRLCGPASNRVVFSKGSMDGLGSGRSRLGFYHSVRVVFRSPCTSLGPHVAIRSVVTRNLSVRNLIGAGRRHHTGIRRLLRAINLGGSRTDHCPRRFSNNRHRHVNVTHTLTIRPHFVVTSRPVSTLSISVRTRIIGLLGSLRRRGNLACLFVTRSLSVIGCVSSHVNIVRFNHLLRMKPTSSICAGPLRSCATDLVSTIPIPSPRFRHGHGRVLCSTSVRRSIRNGPTGLHRVAPNRFIHYHRSRIRVCGRHTTGCRRGWVEEN